MPRSINKLDRQKMRLLEDHLLAHKATIEDGTRTVDDLIEGFHKLHSITVTKANIDSALDVLSIKRPKRTPGGTSALYSRMEAIEARLTLLEEALTHPQKAGQPTRR